MSKLSTLVMTSILGIGLSAAAFANTSVIQNNTNTGYGHYNHQNGNGHRGSGMMHRMGGHFAEKGMHRGGVFRGLNLTQEQQQKMSEVMSQHYNNHGQSGYQFKNHDQLFDLVATDSFNEAAIRTQIEANVNNRVDEHVAMAKAYNEMYMLLTPEQKAALIKTKNESLAQLEQQIAEMQ